MKYLLIAYKVGRRTGDSIKSLKLQKNKKGRKLLNLNARTSAYFKSSESTEEICQARAEAEAVHA